MKKSATLRVLPILLAAALTACSSGNRGANGDGSGQSQVVEPLESVAQYSYSIDHTELTGNRWKMTYQRCQEKEKLDSFTSAADGTEFVLIFFEIENITNESQTFSIIGQDFYIDGVKTAHALYGLLIDGAFPLTTCPVEPGEKANGYFLLQASPEWQEIEILYYEDLVRLDDNNALAFSLSKVTS